MKRKLLLQSHIRQSFPFLQRCHVKQLQRCDSRLQYRKQQQKKENFLMTVYVFATIQPSVDKIHV